MTGVFGRVTVMQNKKNPKYLSFYIFTCKDCGRQFVENPQNKNQPISKNTENHIGAIWNFIHYHNNNLSAP